MAPANGNCIQINKALDFETNAIRNRIWHRGDGDELEQIYQQAPEYTDKYEFQASRCTPGMETRKIHTGLPGLIIRILSAIVLNNMDDFDFAGNDQQRQLREDIAKDNKFARKLEKALEKVLYIGDGAFKVMVDTIISGYPALEWYPGERVETIQNRDRVKEVVFKTPHESGYRQYVLYEHYGYGYIKNGLCEGDTPVPLNAIDAIKGIKDTIFDDTAMLTVSLQVYESTKYEGRGGNISNGKLDSFNAFDETWSQRMDALRVGRARTYIPGCLVPRDPETGKVIRPNLFDDRYFAFDNNMSEDTDNRTNAVQPTIPRGSYLASYCTVLDLCLQDVIGLSTLGVDVKKLGNVEAQREKEKATPYTWNAVVEVLQGTLPKLANAIISACNILHGKRVEEAKVDISFDEYANPSFENRVETLAGVRPGVLVMSTEAQVGELYGDTKDEEQKQEEAARLKEEQGITRVEGPGINTVAGSFRLNMGGEKPDGSQGNEPPVPDRLEGVSGAAVGGKGTSTIGNPRN